MCCGKKKKRKEKKKNWRGKNFCALKQCLKKDKGGIFPPRLKKPFLQRVIHTDSWKPVSILSIFESFSCQSGRERALFIGSELLDVILKLNERNVLEGPGKISHELAKQKAEAEYLKYKEIEKEQVHLESIKELDKDIKQLKGK